MYYVDVAPHLILTYVSESVARDNNGGTITSLGRMGGVQPMCPVPLRLEHRVGDTTHQSHHSHMDPVLRRHNRHNCIIVTTAV